MRIVNLNRPDLDTWRDPATLIVYTTQAYAPELISSIRSRFPALDIIGISSFHGMLLADGLKRGSYGILFEREDGIVSRSMVIDFNGVANVRETVSNAMRKWVGDSQGTPKLFIHSPQGLEERILEGISDAFSGTAQVFGATPGNDSFLPQAFCFLNETCLTSGVVITQLFDERIVCTITCGGYLPTLKKGIVTSSQGRVIRTINDRPAAEVYNEWTDGMFEAYIQRGCVLPRSAGLYPICREYEDARNGGWLSHVYSADRQEKAIHLYSEVPQGSHIQLMRGTESSIVTHVGTAIKKALDLVGQKRVAAALIMYCAGCGSIISDSMNLVCEQAYQAFGDIPFLGCMTYGEQGCLSQEKHNYHGNMMIEIVLILAR